MIKTLFYVVYYCSYALVIPLLVLHFITGYLRWEKCCVCGKRVHPVLMLHSNSRCPDCVEKDLQMGVTIR